MALLKFYRGAQPAAEVGKIWFDTTTNVIKVCTAAPEGAEATWESYGLSEAEIEALILAAKNEVLGTLEDGDSATLAALNDEIDALQAELVALAAKTVTINEKATGYVTVSKTVDAQGATVYTVAENDIASAQGLADEIKRAGDEEARIEGLVTTETGRATEAEGKLAGRLDVIEGEAEGSIKKALADAKAYTDEAKVALLGDATEAGNTLGKLEDRIEAIVANEKTYSVVKMTAEEVAALGNANVKEAYKLIDEDKAAVGDPILVYKDSALKSAAMGTEGDAQKLMLTYILADGSESVVPVDLSAFYAESETGDGLQVIDHVISVKKDAASEAFLTVGADGVKLSGVQDAIDAAKGEAVAAIAPAIEALDADVTSAATYTVTDEEGVESTVDHKVRIQVVEVDGVVTGVNVTESDIASAAKLHEVEYVASAALNALNERVTPLEASVADHEARLTQAEADIDALEGALANKNVEAESTTPDYVTASAADNKVTVAATQKVIDAVASAESAVQTVTSDNACLVATKTGTDVAMSLVWEEF